MLIYSLSRKILFNGPQKTLRRAVEAAISLKISLNGADLRGANLRYAKLDEAVLAGACLWGADLSHADLSGATCAQADFRASCLIETCMAESDFSGTDFKGARFGRTILTESRFDDAAFSCPSLFSCDLSQATGLERAVYWHLGETPCRINRAQIRQNTPINFKELDNHKYISF